MEQKKTFWQKIKWLWNVPAALAGMLGPSAAVTYIPALFDSDWTIWLFLLFPAAAAVSAWLGARLGGPWWLVWLPAPLAYVLAALLIFRETLVLPVLLPALAWALLGLGTAWLTARARRKRAAVRALPAPGAKKAAR